MQNTSNTNSLLIEEARAFVLNIQRVIDNEEKAHNKIYNNKRLDLDKVLSNLINKKSKGLRLEINEASLSKNNKECEIPLEIIDEFFKTLNFLICNEVSIGAEIQLFLSNYISNYKNSRALFSNFRENFYKLFAKDQR